MAGTLTPLEHERVAELAGRYGFSIDAALTLLQALRNSGGGMAQFNHPELGGGGQWMQGGMIMIGDMFNQGLKSRVDGLCYELAGLVSSNFFAASGMNSRSAEDRPEFGVPDWRGVQNDSRYAYYAAARRLVVATGGKAATVYDTGDHFFQGVSQQQQNGGSSLSFATQYGPVPLDSLRVVEEAGKGQPPEASPQSSSPAPLPDAEELAGTAWLFACGGDGGSATVTLLDNGRIGGGDPKHHCYWALERGALRFFAEDGTPSARFDAARRDGSGKIIGLSRTGEPDQTLTRPGPQSDAKSDAKSGPAAVQAGEITLTIPLTSRDWALSTGQEGELCRLRLFADGRIEGGRMNEARWQSGENGLTFLHANGRPTLRFNSFRFLDGRWELGGSFLGEDDLEGTLRQV